MPPKLGLLGEASILHVSVHIPKYSPDHSRSSESHGMHNNQDVPSECQHKSVAKEVVEGWPVRKEWFLSSSY